MRKLQYITLKYFTIEKILIHLLILLSICFDINNSFASVDHKTSQLDSYHNQISDNQEEKAGIIDIIKRYKSGAFLDIGSGRDTISYIINNLQTTELKNVNLIAADLEAKALTEIAKQHPELYFNLDSNSNLDLSLLKMDATEMHQIKDSSIKAINASAVLHEINSYVPYKTPIDRFFGESIRILEKDGFLVYRDPTLQTNPDIINSLIIKHDFAKKFISIFLPKFLDINLTQITDMYGNSIKPNFNYQDRMSVSLYLKGEDKPTNFNYQSFFSLKTHTIDFSKDIIIKAPRRLLSEIQRHYILFVKNVYPIAFVADNAIKNDTSILPSTPKQAKKTVQTFTKNLEIDCAKKLNKKDIEVLTAERLKLDALISNGITINNLDSNKVISLQKLFDLHNVATNLYIISNNKVWLDAKLLVIIYNRLQFDFNKNDLPIDSIKWLAREGEEFYFYFSTDELLGYLVKFCHYYLKDTNKEGYFLAPVTSDHIKYSNRDLYTELLERDMLQVDAKQKKQPFVTSKTIITFQLMTPDTLANNEKSKSAHYAKN